MLEEYLKTEDYKAFLQSDAVFNIEIQRIKDEAKFSEREEEEEQVAVGMLFLQF